MYKGKCIKLKEKLKHFDESIKHRTTRSIENAENDHNLTINRNPMETLNIITNGWLNKSKEISFATVDVKFLLYFIEKRKIS